MEIQKKLDNSRGSFFIEKDGRQVAELDFEIKENILDAYHTGVRLNLKDKVLREGFLMKWLILHVRKVIKSNPHVHI